MSNKTAIVGTGCIGSYIAYLLNSENTTFLVRSKASYSDANQTRFIIVDGKLQALKSPVCQLMSFDFENLSTLIIPVKSYHNAELIQQLSAVLPAHICIIIMQNGIDFLDKYPKSFPHNPILCGLLTDGLYKNDDATVRLAGRGSLLIGSIQNASKSQASNILSAHPDARWVENIESAIYQKLMINAVINPLTFLFECKNGELLKHKDALNALYEEVAALYRKLNLDEVNGYQLVMDVVGKTAHNSSSMLQDRQAKRRTEVDAILGALIKKAEALSLATPLLRNYSERIKAIESAYFQA